MPRFLIRVEAVNFEWSCDDTQELSTVRGGSFLMANAHKLIECPAQMSPVVHGASAAIWSFEVASEKEAEAKRREVEAALAVHRQLQHATFVVDVVPAAGDGAGDMQDLRMRNRWRQYQQPTLAVPEHCNQGDRGGSPQCAFDFVRPARHPVDKGDGTDWVSDSVKTRREYGRGQKRDFYAETVPDCTTWGLRFANDIGDITSREGFGKDDPLKHLARKMAVIYFDGNKQSEMSAEMGLKDLQDFRDYTRTRQAEFLADLLRQIHVDQPAEAHGNDWYLGAGAGKLVRLETLLWGGDDVLLIVPAWKGWDVARLYFDHLAGRRGTGTWHFGAGERGRFTYAAGLVFCNYKASIHSMRELAISLYKQAKSEAKDEKYGNLLGYEVMESYDVAAKEFQRWRASRLCLDKQDSEPLLLQPEQLEPVAALVRAVRAEVAKPDSPLSRRQIERLARSMRKRREGDSKFDNEIETYLALPAFKGIAPLATRQKLYHLAALWDYIK